MMSIEPESLRKKYNKFLQPGRTLLTGHSHQAWPDCAEEGILEAFSDAAAHVDDKWSRAFGKAQYLRDAISRYCGVGSDQVVLGQNTHELFYRFLTALPKNKRHLVASSGEFHSVRRQILALGAEGWTVTWVETHPVQTLGARLVSAIQSETAAIVCSSVLFETSTIVPHLDECVLAAANRNVQIFLDGYHSFMVHPWTLSDFSNAYAFISGGGYKYAQWGEGVCWMTVPEQFDGKPAFTGWFSDFANLDKLKGGQLGYGNRAADRFAGSTYDPISHYRAARVVQFFDDNGLTVRNLRHLSLHQTSRLVEELGAEHLLSPIDADQRGGFVAYRVKRASDMVSDLRKAGIFADSRGSVIRFGPAPYLTDPEIEAACAVIRPLMKLYE